MSYGFKVKLGREIVIVFKNLNYVILKVMEIFYICKVFYYDFKKFKEKIFMDLNTRRENVYGKFFEWKSN